MADKIGIEWADATYFRSPNLVGPRRWPVAHGGSKIVFNSSIVLMMFRIT